MSVVVDCKMHETRCSAFVVTERSLTPPTTSGGIKSQSPPRNRRKIPPTPPPEPAKEEVRLNGVTESQLRCAFSMIDANHDGKINEEELMNMLRDLRMPVNHEVVKQMMKDATQNGDGLISEEQFLRWMAKAIKSQKDDDIEGDLRAAFRVFDRDNNGFITREELSSAMSIMGESLTDSDLDCLLNETDIDKDGRIDYEEFINMLL